MPTLALYIGFLIAQGSSYRVELSDVLRDYAEIEKFLAYAKNNSPYVLSEAAIAEIRAGKKIQAIKIVRAEHAPVDGAIVGLKEAKGIVDDYVAAHPSEYPTTYTTAF